MLCVPYTEPAPLLLCAPPFPLSYLPSAREANAARGVVELDSSTPSSACILVSHAQTLYPKGTHASTFSLRKRGSHRIVPGLTGSVLCTTEPMYSTRDATADSDLPSSVRQHVAPGCWFRGAFLVRLV